MSIETLAAQLAPTSPLARPVQLAWYGCDLRTGQIIEDLPALRPTGALSRRIGAVTNTTFELDLGGAPRGWEAATDAGRTMLVAVDTETDLPIWPGLVLTRAGGSAQTISIGTATPEAYLDRRYTADQTLVQQDQADVLTSLMTAPLTNGGPPFVMDAPPTGALMDLELLDADDRTVLSAMQEAMGMEGGPEWHVDVDWSDSDHTGFVLPVRVRPKIGTQTDQPEGTFDFPGCVVDYDLAESYESGKGATVVQARGEGEGSSRLTSTAQVATALESAGWPRYVYRYTPAQGLTDPDALTAHAVQALALMGTGARVWTLNAVASRSPRLGRDWSIGDTVRLAVERSPRHPDGADITARAWSWELDPGADRLSPILVEED